MLKKEKTEFHVNQLIAIYNIMHRNGDVTNARKIKDLYHKYLNDHKSISFVGHFSAGKSSFINALLGDDILPESPIPTSANIVQITSGKGNVKVFFNDKEPEIYNEPYNIDMIKNYCMQKGTISQIDISTSQALIPNKWAFYDTPGIDAADDADRLITESSMHLVDVFVYIMDYNHVQSEANMYFLQYIEAIGIPFFIMINQIDKHNESELSFSTFRGNVNQTFDQWQIHPQDIYYTSMMDTSMQENQFIEAKHRLMDLMVTKDNTVKTIARSFANIVDAHVIFLQTEYEKAKTEIGSIPNVDTSSLKKAENKVQEIENWPHTVYKLFIDALQVSLKNAYVMPAAIRDKARLFLESQQKDFKVGILGSRKKTELEKEKRLEDFLIDLNQTIQTTIQWKVRDKFLALLTDNNIHDTRLVEEANNISLTYTKEDLLKQVKSGAKVNGNYVLHYTDDVAGDIKKQFKENVQPFLRSMYETLTTLAATEMEPYKEEKKNIEHALQQKHLLAKETATYKEKQLQVQTAFKATTVTPEETAFMEQNEETSGNQTTKQVDPHPHENQMEIQEIGDKGKQDEVITPVKEVHQVVHSLEETMKIIDGLPGFQSFKSELAAKQAKLQDRSLTIALFGAFSAGKSSFANALLGEGILPSSPQPTTAVINRILPVSTSHTHGTVVVQYKDEATMVSDIWDIVKDYAPNANTLAHLVQWIQESNILEANDLSDVYRSYLQAVQAGYASSHHLLGENITLTLEDLDTYLTNESISCFLESVDIYYQCALTDQQITLVDTPGADSVNRRHTNVAFNYIKHADAIFYVTYYNHALSRADKAFLTQLGRVKDVFQLDKMFFIINATDLAKNKADLQLVNRYVANQLVDLGIRFPAIFPISSKQVLASKKNNATLPKEMNDFEETFNAFIHQDLPALTIQSGLHDIHRVYQALLSYIDSIELNQEEKNMKKSTIYEQQTVFNDMVNQKNISVMETQFIQKVEKQLYYVEERMQIQFHDMFKDAYNPTTITESGKKGHDQLKNNLRDLLNNMGFELVQEMQAVALRVEAKIQTLLDDFYEEMVQGTKSISHSFILPRRESDELAEPDFNRAFEQIDLHLFDKVFSTYKGTRAFFVKNEKVAFKEALYAILEPIIHDYVTKQQKIMVDTYQTQLMNSVTSLKMFLKDAMQQYVDNQIQMLSDTMDKGEVIRKKQELEAILL